MNAYEAWLKKKLEERGYTVIRTGWPDFLCWKGSLTSPSEVLAVEAKRGTDELDLDQMAVGTILDASGVPFRVIRPDDIGRDESLSVATEHEYKVRTRQWPWDHRDTCTVCLSVWGRARR